MRGIKTLLIATALFAGLALAPAANAQISIGIGIQPVCSYGYYDYAPYACAPYGFYGPGYFYGGVFLGMGPWAGWGYGHGWGSHRFVSEGGGSYHGGGGAMANRSSFARGSGARGGTPVRSSGNAYHANPGNSHVAVVNRGGNNAGGARPSASHAAAPRANGGGGAPHASGGGGGGGHQGGGGHK